VRRACRRALYGDRGAIAVVFYRNLGFPPGDADVGELNRGEVTALHAAVVR
jgi:hypothetical protein